MDIVERCRARIRGRGLAVVFPEGGDERIVAAASRLRDEGLALVVISSELDEVVAYSSRIVVMRDREMVAELSGENINPGVIVQAIANHRDEEVA